MLEQTKRISFRISSVLSKVEPEPYLHTGSGSNPLRLRNTVHHSVFMTISNDIRIVHTFNDLTK